MKINTYLVQLGITMIIIFGGTFSIRYFRTGEVLLDQIICVGVGVVVLILSLLWRSKNYNK